MSGRAKGGGLARRIGAVALVAFTAAAEAAPLRVHAVGYKHAADQLASYADYRSHLDALARAALDGDAGAPPGAERVLVFPEDSALFAMFAGARGAPFRALEPLLKQGGGNGAAVAVAGLFGGYQAQAAYYRLKFPEQNGSETRLGLLALTDTTYRTFFETFRAIAVEHHAWIVAAANVAPAEITTDPVKVALLGDPEAIAAIAAGGGTPYAYEATSPNVYNQAFVFDPTGELVRNPFGSEGDLDGAAKKTYLVPIEQGPVEQGKIGLDLAYGDLRQARPVDVAGVPTAILISKPAWMPDELGRLEAYDARVLLQPEAFSAWGTPVDDWQPDVLKQSNWSAVQKYAPFRFGALAELTGNFFDLVFDGQSHVVAKATVKDAVGPGLRYVGQPDDVGWLDVGAWVVGDGPGERCAGSTLAARRACLAEVGRALAPASGDARENGYFEPRAVGTVDLGPPAADATREPGTLGANVRVDDAPDAARARNPKIARGLGGAAYVAWQDDRSGVDQIRIARIDPSGAASASVAVSPSSGRQVSPQIAVSPSGRIHVVWQELEPRPRLRFALAERWGQPFFDAPGPFDLCIPPFVSCPIDVEAWKPAIAAGDDKTLHVAWIGLEDDGLEHLRYAALADGVVGFARDLDGEAFPAPSPLAERLNNRWSPAISVRGHTVAVAWTDFRNYAWDLFATVSRDGGMTFSPHFRVDDAGTALERLENDPSVEIAGDGTVRVAWTDQAGRRAGCATCARQRRPDADIAFASLAPTASAFTPNRRVDDTGDGLQTDGRIGFSNQWRPALAEASGRLVAAWQDQRNGNDDIYLATSVDGGASWSANRRIDDTGSGPSNQYAPAIAVAGDGTATIVWQDDRDGADHVYAARGAP